MMSYVGTQVQGKLLCVLVCLSGFVTGIEEGVGGWQGIDRIFRLLTWLINWDRRRVLHDTYLISRSCQGKLSTIVCHACDCLPLGVPFSDFCLYC